MASLSLLRMRASYVIIPGWGLPRLQSQWLGLLLQSKGYVHHFEYALQDQTLHESATQLRQLLKTVDNYSPPSSACHFVTCNYGALLLRKAFRLMEWEGTSNILMLTPPNRGCERVKKMWKGWGGIARQEMENWNMSDVDAQLRKMPCRTSTVVLTAKLPGLTHDGLVHVEETRLNGKATYESILAPHFLVPYHPTTIYHLMRLGEA